MRTARALATLASAVSLVPALALAQPDVTPSFGAVVTGPQAPGVWYVDRYAPATFQTVPTYQGRNGVLQIGIAEADAPENRPAPYNDIFYNTQGRKYDLNTGGPFTLSADLYVPGDWANASLGFRRTDMWATLTDALNNVTGYPIIGFTNYGGPGRFRAWDGAAWTDFGATVNYDAWNTLAFVFDGSAVTYSVNGAAQGTAFAGSGSTQAADVIMQAYNFGQSFGANAGPSYDAYWANTATVPEPATVGLMATGLVGLGAVARRRRR